MSQNNDAVQITIRVSDLEERLYKLLRDHPHGRLIAHKIIHNLQATDRGMEHLFLAFSGVEATCPYKVGDKVYVAWNNASVYRFDKEKMREAGMIYSMRGKKNDYILSEILEVDMRKSYGIHLSYPGLDSAGAPITGDTVTSEHNIHPKDPVFFSKFNEEPSKTDDLPF